MERLIKPVFQHGLTEQELSMLNPGQQAIAKDWSITNKKLDWIIDKLVEQSHSISEISGVQKSHELILKVTKAFIAIFGSGGVFGLIYVIAKLLKLI